MFLSAGGPKGLPGVLGFPGRSSGRPFCGRSRVANFPPALGLVLRHRSVFPFEAGQSSLYSGSAVIPTERATQAVFLSPAHRSPFHQWLIGVTYRTTRTPWDLTSHDSRPFSPSDRTQHLAWPPAGNRVSDRGERLRGSLPSASRRSVLGAPAGRSAISRSVPAWPLRYGSFSGPPGGPALAAYLRWKSRSSGRNFRTVSGTAQVGFGRSLLSYLTV
jgi:hypothetical protein